MSLDIEDLKSAIVAFVQSHYVSNSNKPLLLSRLGLELGQDGYHVPSTRSGSLKRFIEKNLSGVLEIVRHPDIPSFVAVALLENVEAVRVSLAKKKVRSSEGRKVEELPRSLLIAFCRKLPEGVRLRYSIAPPFGYVVGETAGPDENLVEIDQDLRLPGIWLAPLGRLDAEIAERIREKVEVWAMRHHVDLSALRVTAIPSNESLSEGTTNALVRSLAAQSAEARTVLNIPADIADILLRHP